MRASNVDNSDDVQASEIARLHDQLVIAEHQVHEVQEQAAIELDEAMANHELALQQNALLQEEIATLRAMSGLTTDSQEALAMAQLSAEEKMKKLQEIQSSKLAVEQSQSTQHDSLRSIMKKKDQQIAELRTHTHAHTHACTHPRTHARMLACPRARTHACTHRCIANRGAKEVG